MDDVLKGILIGGIFSLLTVIIPLVLNRRKSKADEQASLAEVIVKSAQALDITSDQLIEAFREVKLLREEARQVRAELESEKKARQADNERMQKELRRWGLYASLLSKQVIDAGLEPVAFPPETDPKMKGLNK